MRRFSPAAMMSLLLGSLISSGIQAYQVELQTRVYRLSVDGSVEELDFSGSVSGTEAASRPDPNISDSEPEQTDGAVEDSSVFVVKPEPVKVQPSKAEVAAGDALRYELVIHNKSQFTIPALALELSENLPAEVELLTIRSADNEGWLFEPITPFLNVSKGGDSPVAANVAAALRAIRIKNASAIMPGEQRLFAYEVTVNELIVDRVNSP